MSIAPFGAAPFGALSAGAANDTGSLSATIEWLNDVGSLYSVVHWTGYNAGPLYSTIDWQLNTGSLFATINWQTPNTGSLFATIEWQAQDESSYPASTENWSITLTIAGTDFSDNLRGILEIDYEEDSSGIADFSLVPDAGAIDLMSWIGNRVIIHVTSGANTAKRFHGLVSNVVYDPEAALLDFTCTTNLQGYFENATRENIASLVGGYWSEHVFNDDGDGWTYAQDRLATQFVSVHQDYNGKPVITSLEAKSTPDFTFVDSGRFNNTLSLSRATRRDLVNRIRMTFSYRYTKLRQRHLEYALHWVSDSGSLSWCDYLVANYTLLSRSEVESAIEASGWQLLGNVIYEPVPSSGYFKCTEYSNPNLPQSGQSLGWVINSTQQAALCLGAHWKMAKRFSQTVDEQYVFDIRAGNSIEYAGEIGLDQKFSIDHLDNNTGWETEPFTGVAAGAVLDESGDYIIDELDGDGSRADFENAYNTALAQAITTMRKSHRENTVSYEVPYHSQINLTHTAKVIADAMVENNLVAQGKVRQLVHTFNLDSGDAFTRISLALSLHGGTGIVVDSSLDPVVVEPVALPAFTKSFVMNYHIGGDPSSLPEDAEWDGFVTNRHTPIGNYPVYDEGFKIRTPDISEDYRNTLLSAESRNINVNIKQDLLTIAA